MGSGILYRLGSGSWESEAGEAGNPKPETGSDRRMPGKVFWDLESGVCGMECWIWSLGVWCLGSAIWELGYLI